MAEREYTRLARSRMRRKQLSIVGASLWLGKDHVLSIESKNFSETYRRFFFRDIQAIFIRKTNRRMTWNWILGALLVPSLIVLNVSRSAGIGPEMLAAILVLIFAFPLIINNLLGSTCAVYFRSAVQIEEVPALGRIGRARRTINRIRPLIASSQEDLPPAEVSARIQALQSGKPVTIPAPPEPEPDRTEP